MTGRDSNGSPRGRGGHKACPESAWIPLGELAPTNRMRHLPAHRTEGAGGGPYERREALADTQHGESAAAPAIGN